MWSKSYGYETNQKLIFEENHEEDSLKNWETSLTAWFDLNKKK